MLCADLERLRMLLNMAGCVPPDQRNLGMSMRVERSTLDQVKKRFEVNKKKMEEKQKDYDFEERMKELREEVSVGNSWQSRTPEESSPGSFSCLAETLCSMVWAS